MALIQVPWNLKDVFAVYVLRLIVGILLVRVVFPLLFMPNSFIIEITDRLVILILCWAIVHRYQKKLSDFGISLKGFARNTAYGVLGGAVLLGFSMFSERMLTTVLFLTPEQHPLVAQVQNATALRMLIGPLFLAGLAAPVAEEVLYRMVTFLSLKKYLGLWGGAFGSAIVFALLHFNVYWLAEMVVVGVGLALLYFWTGSLVSAVVAHAFINTSKILMIFFNISLI